MTTRHPPRTRHKPTGLARHLPFLHWLRHYRRADLPGDLLAGLIVAIMLVPQGMAYALLAGLPPQVGLYASIAPLLIYGLLGSSRALAVGPVAIVSLLVAASVGPLANGQPDLYWQLALALALLVGVIQLAMGLLRVGFLVNFLSHPVLVGFTAAAAIVIGFSQVKHVLGFAVPRTDQLYQQVLYVFGHLPGTNPYTVAVGAGSIAVLLLGRHWLPGWLARLGVAQAWRVPLAKSAPLQVALLGTLAVALFGLEGRGVAVVGDVPPGLPPLTVPAAVVDWWRVLLPAALTISFVGYMESISVAKSLASKKRQRIDADQELLALGAANLGAAFSGGYPVTGGFSRSIVNFTAGANTGLASVVTAGLIALTVIFLTPTFYYLPKAVLAGIILVAVANLIDLRAIRHIWRYDRRDGLALAVTFVAVLAFGIELGILAGMALSLGLYIWRTSRPHVAVMGRVGTSREYANAARHPVVTWPHVVLLRVDESLYFANTKFLEDTVLELVEAQPQVEAVVLVCSAVNFIDASALETLEALHDELAGAGVALHLAGVKGPVLDRLRAIGFVEHLGPARIHFSVHRALHAIGWDDRPVNGHAGPHPIPKEQPTSIDRTQMNAEKR